MDEATIIKKAMPILIRVVGVMEIARSLVTFFSEEVGTYLGSYQVGIRSKRVPCLPSNTDV